MTRDEANTRLFRSCKVVIKMACELDVGLQGVFILLDHQRAGIQTAVLALREYCNTLRYC